MLTLFFFGFVGFFCCFALLVHHFIKKRNHPERNFPKKVFFTTFIASILFIGISLNEDVDMQKINELELENDKLTTEVSGLKRKVKEYKLNLENSEKEIAKLNDSVTSADNEIKELEKKNKKLTDDINELKKDKESLLNKVSQLEKDTKILKTENNKLKENNSQQTSSKESSSSNSNVKSSSSNSGSNNSKNTSSSSNEDCNIKGSNTGIYHVPGSTYYNKTKNVAQWFCSEEEAKNAGYRAPKR